MKCPYCTSDESKVTDKREAGDAEFTRRRRECLKCNKRYTTYERVEYDLMVVKKDGRREPYNREKLKMGLLKACEKREVSSEKIDKAIGYIEGKLRSRDSNEIPSKIVGELVMKKLKSLDKVAYIRFASVYKDFAAIQDFQNELKKLVR